jgi:hypothetical protein
MSTYVCSCRISWRAHYVGGEVGLESEGLHKDHPGHGIDRCLFEYLMVICRLSSRFTWKAIVRARARNEVLIPLNGRSGLVVSKMCGAPRIVWD